MSFNSAIVRSSLLLMCGLLTGCANNVPLNEANAVLLVARGHLQSGELHRWLGCSGPADFLEVVNCAAGVRSNARFIAEEAIVGIAHRRHLRITFDYAPYWPTLEVGTGKRYVGVFLTDGTRYEMYGIAPIAQTEDGGWAIPITFDREIPQFPCFTEDSEPEPLRFRPPRPREDVASLGLTAAEIDGVKDEGAFSVEDGYLYANMGVRLEHASEAYAGKSALQVAGACH